MELLFIVALSLVLIIAYVWIGKKQEAIETLQTTNRELFQSFSNQADQLEAITEQNNSTFQQLQQLRTKYDEVAYQIMEAETLARDKARDLLHAWKTSEEAAIRADAVKRSKRVLLGNSTEQIAPYLVDLGNPADIRFLGSPIDFICFQNAAAIRNGDADQIEKILLVDIKTGKSKLSKVQRRIRDAVADGRVEFMTVTLETDNV